MKTLLLSEAIQRSLNNQRDDAVFATNSIDESFLVAIESRKLGFPCTMFNGGVVVRLTGLYKAN
jgi:hypothetical protein